MNFAEELYIGTSIIDADIVINMLKNGRALSGIFCICKKDNGKFMYEILEARELLAERNKNRYKVFGIATGKNEALEVLRYMVEDRHEY